MEWQRTRGRLEGSRTSPHGAEFAALYDVKRLQVSQWISRDHTLDYRYAKIISGSPYWLLQFVKGFGETTPRPKHLNETELARLVKEQDPGYWVGEVSQLPRWWGRQSWWPCSGCRPARFCGRR